jgi:predicted double-glycine peptidase
MSLPSFRSGARRTLAALAVVTAMAVLPPPRSDGAGRAPARLLPVPLISQATPWTCGAASLMAALVYFGVFDEPESRLDDELHATPEQGVHPERIAAEARAFGLAAEVRTGLTLDQLAAELARGSIVILDLQAWPAGRSARASLDVGWEDGHYVVLVGLDDRHVYAMDPSVRTGYAYLTRDALLKRWHDYEVRDGRREEYERLGIVLRGRAALRSYPAEPTRIE